MPSHNFQINLRGIIDLLSNHLYSTPHTFLRELLQNGVDAITARLQLDAKHEGEVSIELVPGAQPTLIFEDNGIGLTEPEIHKFLATIGESSKRLANNDQPSDFIGRFGIGLLSCFVVADEIVVLTRSARDKGKVLEWKGRDDGTYTIRETGSEFAPGTRVFLRARPDAAEHFSLENVRERVMHYGGLLPVPVHLVQGGARKRLNDQPAPWRSKHASRKAEDKAMLEFGQAAFGLRFHDWIPLKSKAGGVEGVAFVLPHATSLAARQQHRVYLRNMLLTETADNLLPPWAFFVRCVVNATDLRPTASRENFYEDKSLEKARNELGGCLRDYIIELAESDKDALRRLIGIHQRSFKALAAEDDDFFKVIADLLPFETTQGLLSLGEIRAQGEIRYAPTVDQFRQIAGVAAAQGLCVVNGGYVNDTDLLERVADIYPDVTVEAVDASDVAQGFEELTSTERDKAFAFLRAADDALRAYGCRTELRRFQPTEMPALYSVSRDGEFQRDLERTREGADSLWGGILDNLSSKSAGATSAELTFNFSNPMVARLTGLRDEKRLKLAVEMLYVQALLLGHHPLRSKELNALNRGLLELVELGLEGGK
ncbi:MAG: HSP90 family protein [Planctomycetes bacterium]|nr:HSP90 family protein [Planctomycetota bacterium]